MKTISLLLLAPALCVNFFEKNFQKDQAKQKVDSAIIAPGSKLQLISKQFSFTEGPTADKNGVVFFTDQPNDKIWKYSEDGKLAIFMDKAGRANGMYFDKKGNLIVCADEKTELRSIHPSGKVNILADNFEGKRFNGPNDVWVSPKGNTYFTDPYYQRPYWSWNKPELSSENVYILPKGQKEPIVAADGFVRPNGLVGTPDGKLLYLTDINDNKTYRYKIGSKGELTNKTLFVEQGCDGMTIDDRGNVYLAGKGITVYNPAGKKIEHIEVPEDWTSNVCFFGKNKNLLFITAGKGIYFIPTLVKGVSK